MSTDTKEKRANTKVSKASEKANSTKNTDSEPAMKQKMPLGWKIRLAILIAVATLGTATVIFSYKTYQSSLETQLIEAATCLAETIAAQVNPDSVDKYLESGETDEQYFETREAICKIVRNNEIEYSVVTKPTEEGFYYLYDSDESDEAFQLGDFQEFYPGDFLDNKENFLAGNEITPIITNEEFGWLLSVLVPIKDNNGTMKAYVDVDMSMNEIKDMMRSFLITEILIIAGVLIILTIVADILAGKRIVKPINKLADAAGKFASSESLDTKRGNVINLRGMNTGDEIERLYRSFRKMEKDIYKYIDNLTAVTAEKERIGAELNVATKIQEDMLPSIFPAFPEKQTIDIYATMHPAKEVGGDFYDFFMVDDDRIALVMADVSGKGVPAALLMVIAKTIIKYRTQMGGKPSEILEYVNDRLCESNDYQFFVTCWLSIIDIKTGEAIAVNAGHEKPAIRRRNGEYELISGRHGLPLAAMEGTKYRDVEYTLNRGDSLFVYTDGVTEATDGNNELFGEKRLTEALNLNPGAMPKDTIDTVDRVISEFVGDVPQFDDITMLGFMMKDD